jgi:arginyl-tRNA--protein-N-Asp/Glu arginylyltransferase
MSNYLIWNKKTITDFSIKAVTDLYSRGYVFTREHKGAMYQTRVIRINLVNFSPNSENRRVLKKVEDLELNIESIPPENYTWHVHKLGKEFYQQKFGSGQFSATKIRELVTDKEKSNFNKLYSYTSGNETVGYCICYENSNLLHYAYPFYNSQKFSNNYGMGMMLLAILNSQTRKDKYIYLGSASRPEDKYKLQFSGLEWFDGKTWTDDIDGLKGLLSESAS